MRPYLVCHMVSSIDGRILNSRWRPKTENAGQTFEKLHERLEGDAWVIGRVTGQEFAKAKAYPAHTGETFPREPHIVRRDADAYGVVLDAQGKIAWGRSDIGGDPIVVVLTRQVPDAHLAGLRKDGVSYFFAGDAEIDLGQAVEFLRRELGIERLLVEGGGGANGAFLRAGLIDEVSVAVYPALDGAKGAPSVFDSGEHETDRRAPLESVSLQSSEVLDDGTVWLRYRLRNVKHS